MTTTTPETVSGPQALLEAANTASEKVAALHIAFLVLCTYILVVVFSTTDMDLLIGKGVRLPVVDVEVPIVGFYATAPYLLVLVHFNLLLQLQLLSRKLFAFDNAAPKHEGVGGLHDQLNIFPYNYYLVGRPTRLVWTLAATLVIITVLLLPLLTILLLQARFLAYQSEAVTWAQRAATWLDVVLVATLWPVIMDRRDSWRDYLNRAWRRAVHYRLRWLWGLFGFAILVSLLASEFGLWAGLLIFSFVAWLLLTLLCIPLRQGLNKLTRGRYFTVTRVTLPAIAGAPGLLAILLLGLPLPLLLVMEGERLDRPNTIGSLLLLSEFRHLALSEKILFAKPPKPETLADLRSADLTRRETALRAIERLDLRSRGLRQAKLSSASIANADLREALLEGADLQRTQLQRANLRGAKLQGANLESAQLQGANLESAQLQGADLRGAQLQGANLEFAGLRSAKLFRAELQGANLRNAQLQGTSLVRAQLRGADLRGAQLEGADLSYAQLQGADLTDLELRYTKLDSANLELAQLQGANLPSPSLLGAKLHTTTPAGLLRSELETLACQSPDIAHGILGRYERDSRSPKPSATKGFASHLESRLKKGLNEHSCPGLVSLTASDKELLRQLALQATFIKEAGIKAD